MERKKINQGHHKNNLALLTGRHDGDFYLHGEIRGGVPSVVVTTQFHQAALLTVEQVCVNLGLAAGTPVKEPVVVVKTVNSEQLGVIRRSHTVVYAFK